MIFLFYADSNLQLDIGDLSWFLGKPMKKRRRHKRRNRSEHQGEIHKEDSQSMDIVDIEQENEESVVEVGKQMEEEEEEEDIPVTIYTSKFKVIYCGLNPESPNTSHIHGFSRSIQRQLLDLGWLFNNEVKFDPHITFLKTSKNYQQAKKVTLFVCLCVLRYLFFFNYILIQIDVFLMYF